MIPLIEEHLDALGAVARAYGAARLEVFRSVCTPEFDPERSDIDFMVEYPPTTTSGRGSAGCRNWRRRSRRCLGERSTWS